VVPDGEKIAKGENLNYAINSRLHGGARWRKGREGR
jgi:hypothetical protein